MAGNTSAIAVTGLGAGMVLIYSGLKGKGLLSSIQTVVSGHNLSTLPTSKNLAISGSPANAISTQNTEAGTPTLSGTLTPGQGTSTQNEALGRLMAASYGWVGSQYTDLVSLWTRESGWNANARNSSSGAYGIAQALGHGTAATAAANGTNEYGGYGVSNSVAKAANGGSAAAQIDWGLAYIKATYGSPANAWAHETSAGWY